MRDPFAWSIPLGRLFGITIRIHFLFPIVVLGLILRVACMKDEPPGHAPSGQWIDVTVVLLFLFVSVLLHEFGHCFGARLMQGDANEVLLWPLGGLANCEVPHTPRANFVVAFSGPLVNLVLTFFFAFLLFGLYGLQPPWNPLYCLARSVDGTIALKSWSGTTQHFGPFDTQVLLSQLFWVNYLLSLVNLCLVGFPFDAGRMLQSILWNFCGYRKAMLIAVFVGFVVMVIVGVAAIIMNEMLALALCLFIYIACKHQWIVLESGGEESLFGYDFSQGYTSLERDQPTPHTPPKQSWWARWRQKRAAKKLQRELERRESEERRMDQLLEKISLQGMSALTDEERRFMKQFSDRYKNRHQ